MLCVHNDDIEIDLNIDENNCGTLLLKEVIRGILKMVMCLLMSLEDFRSCKERNNS